jgi:hypothetical protein
LNTKTYCNLFCGESMTHSNYYQAFVIKAGTNSLA